MDREALPPEMLGVLVGWSHLKQGDGLNLNLQCVRSRDERSRPEVDSHHLMLTNQQAAVLANYLFEASGQTQPVRRAGILARLLGA
ncbi:MAG: hypothetical protein H6916_11905 [Novosphingobium sp.]|uniref:hypothetical protein n=1 Tax=Novosphingobium sp. TaxID=1874826 RepID=UPI001D8D2525|nr:hypothetical protein [Novosphingobium sp.]MCB2058122.1 hypothetical protein [Novosphingobium sp.]MCP5387498.1 hypothetical protein [Novosphingobium sp.]